MLLVSVPSLCAKKNLTGDCRVHEGVHVNVHMFSYTLITILLLNIDERTKQEYFGS